MSTPLSRLNERDGALVVEVLVSGSGTLLQALIDACADTSYGVRIAHVTTDRRGALGLDRAKRAGLQTAVVDPAAYGSRAAWDRALADRIEEHSPHLVVSAGFMRILGPAVLSENVIINTHPALLPSFPGAHGVRDALSYGVRVSGTTCHLVDAGVDTGPIIDQRAVAVWLEDTPETLHERIKVAERQLLVDVVGSIARGGLRVDGRRALVGGPGDRP
ncbi:MAG: phosphoribosylglycinamide formyltransferase [Nostocoides sp.]